MSTILLGTITRELLEEAGTSVVCTPESFAKPLCNGEEQSLQALADQWIALRNHFFDALQTHERDGADVYDITEMRRTKIEIDAFTRVLGRWFLPLDHVSKTSPF